MGWPSKAKIFFLLEIHDLLIFVDLGVLGQTCSVQQTFVHIMIYIYIIYIDIHLDTVLCQFAIPEQIF